MDAKFRATIRSSPTEEKISFNLSCSSEEESLIRAVKNGQDLEARWNMMMASTEGAMAFSKGLGAVHSMSHALGADQELRLHHGTLNGVILPTILRFNKDHVGNKYSKILRAMGKDSSVDLADEIEILNQEIGLPNGLAEMGVTEDMIPGLVEHSMTDPSNATTPRLPSKEEWEKLFLDALYEMPSAESKEKKFFIDFEYAKEKLNNLKFNNWKKAS